MDGGVDAQASDAGLDAGVDGSCGDGGTPIVDESTCAGRPCPMPRTCVDYGWPDGGMELMCDTDMNGGFRTISSGRAHSCVVSGTTYRVACWGDDGAGQLGGETLPSETAAHYDRWRVVVVPGLTEHAHHAAAGDDFTCIALLEEIVCFGGSARSWGRTPGCGERASLTLDGGRRTVAYPIGYAGIPDRPPTHTALDAGNGFACALATDGTVWCWGRGDRGQLGNDPAIDPSVRALPVQVPLEGFTAVGISVGHAHACAWDAEGGARCWGANERAQLGARDRDAHAGPQAVTAVVPPLPIASMAAGGEHTCAIVEDPETYRVVCWGSNTHGQASLGSLSAALLESVDIGDTAGAREISAGATHTYMARAPSVRCWGSNGEGECNDLWTSMPVSYVFDVPAETHVVAGDQFSCWWVAGSPFCHGDNRLGQLGSDTEGDWFRGGDVY